MTRSSLQVENIAIKDVSCETTWASVTLADNNKLVVGVFYRQPNSSTEQVEQLELAIEQVTHKFRNNNNITYILGGHFNTPYWLGSSGRHTWLRPEDGQPAGARPQPIWPHPSASQPYTGE